MCVENGDEDELTELLKRFVDEYKPLLDPEAVKEVEADKTAKEGA